MALVGNGTSEPLGISGYTDHEIVSMATNGAAPDSYDEIIALLSELQTNKIVNGIDEAKLDDAYHLRVKRRAVSIIKELEAEKPKAKKLNIMMRCFNRMENRNL